jgi:hypothetical protein
LRAGSGNTKNIGSFVSDNPNDFKTHSGPFAAFSRPKEACDHYWANYEHYVALINTTNQLLTNADFTEFL